MKEIDHIIILGGGSSGWITALALIQKLRRKVFVTLIEDSKKGTIGVGEGTQPFTAQFLLDCGLDLQDWMKSSNASLKLGVEFSGWTDESYFVDNDYYNYSLKHDLHIANYYTDKKYSEYKDNNSCYNIAKSNKSHKFKGNLDFNLLSSPHSFGAVHFSANDIVETIKKKILSKIRYVDTSIIDVITNDNGVYQLVGDNKEIFTADLFIDCSGFQSELLGKSLNVPFNSYEDYLFNDRCVVIQTQYFNPEKECVPYTKATTMNAGWRFTIPIFSRIGNGYVYSSKFISDEDAEEELRESLGEFKAPSRFIDMKLGRYTKTAYKNVCAIGLSSGFVEPLEATGLTSTTLFIQKLIFTLNQFDNKWSDENVEILNFITKNFYTEVSAFIWAHYYFSTRSDTPYWKAIRNLKITDLPENVRKVIDYYYPNYPRLNLSEDYPIFASHHWFSVIAAGTDELKNKISLTDDEKEYCKYFLAIQEAKTNYILENNLNHYEYLKQWYNS
jgi:tryptophan halogenase